ncbi:MAG: hypothetical protein ACOYD4_06735 [Solirubrobacterales bacterium]
MLDKVTINDTGVRIELQELPPTWTDPPLMRKFNRSLFEARALADTILDALNLWEQSRDIAEEVSSEVRITKKPKETTEATP